MKITQTFRLWGLAFLASAGLNTATASATPDTIKVERAWLTGPYTVSTPLRTDSLNLGGQPWDVSEYLTNNAGVVRNIYRQYPEARLSGKQIACGDGLMAGSINVATFTIDADRYTKLKVVPEKWTRHKVYVNGNEQAAGAELRLWPGRTEISLMGYSDEAAKDTFSVNLVGEELAGHVTLNSSGKRLFSFDDVVHGKNYRSTTLSPTGRYLITQYYDTRHDGSMQWSVKVTETTTGRIVYQPATHHTLSWMPMRDVLWFERTTDDGREIVMLDPQTQMLKVLAANIPAGEITLAPNEEYLIISKTDKGPEETNGLKRLKEPDDRMPGWRERSSLYRYDIKTGTLQRLTYGAQSMYLADISRDSRSLLLMEAHIDPARAPFYRTTVMRMDALTAKTDTLLRDTIFIASVSFSPDARQLLVKATPSAFGNIGNELRTAQVAQQYDYRLFVYDIETQVTTPLLMRFDPSVADVQWSSGDGMIYFTADEGYDKTLWRVDPKSKNRLRYDLPLTIVKSFSLSDTKQVRIACFGGTALTSREAYTAVLGATAKNIQRIGDINFSEVTDKCNLPECHEWEFTASRGDTIKGFYYLPPNMDPAKKYPVIVYYYGGCTPTTRQLEYFYPLSVYASMGYVVLAINPSGCIGYGQEFAARHVGAWGQMTADDIIEGAQTFCRTHDFANAEKIGCIGASYGGFMTQYLQTRTDIFAAAVSHAGISNITSYWGGGYWGFTYGEVAQYGQYPWNNPELYTQQSPLFAADKIHTPLLLLHGTEDTNVPTNESQQLYTALRILGRPVEYVQVNGANHVVTDYKLRQAWQEVIFAWFARWLKDEPTWWDTLYQK